jgi:NAD(P) transhydrogenase
LIDGRDTLLPFLDADLSARLQAAMTRLGVKFVWKESVTACPDPGEHGVCLTLSSGRTLQADHVLVCAGRYCKTPELNPTAAGLTLADKGRIPVDRHFRSNVAHIYAVGDVIGFPALASTSAEQGRAAACHAFDATPQTDAASVLPTGIYTIPEVSSAGLTEAEVKQSGTAYVVGRAEYGQSPRGKIIGERDGFLKLIFRADDLRLLGVHVLGEMASEVVHIGVMALMQQAGADLFLRTCFNYPTLGELYKYATHDAIQGKRGLGK